MRERIRKTILVDYDAWMYLERESGKQRGCNPLTDEQERKVWKHIWKVNEMAEVSDISFGGGDGTYDGKWWSWSLETIKKMLDDAGYHYEIGPDVKCIDCDLYL